MNTKKLVLFGASGLVLAGALVYALGIYPPSSSRDGQGAIGKRDVYRAPQPADANVSPDAAPVATQANSKDVKTPELQNGQIKDGQINSGIHEQIMSNGVQTQQIMSNGVHSTTQLNSNNLNNGVHLNQLNQNKLNSGVRNTNQMNENKLNNGNLAR